MTLTSETPEHKLKVCQRGDWLAFRGPWYLGRTEPNQKTFSTFQVCHSIPSRTGKPHQRPGSWASHLAQGMSSAPTFLQLQTKVSGEPGGPNSASQEALLQFQNLILEIFQCILSSSRTSLSSSRPAGPQLVSATWRPAPL